MPIPVTRNQDIELDITALGSEGQGIGRFSGYAVFADGAIPGERISAKVIKTGSSFGVAKLTRIISPSKERTTPRCPYYGRCGGCALQHMAYDAQLCYKTRLVKDALSRIGGFADPEVLPAIGMDEPWRYRNKAAFPAVQTEKGIGFGMFAARSHRVVPVSDCLIQNAAGTQAMRAVKAWAEECGLKGFDEATGRGELRHVITRTSTAGKTMVTVVTTGSLPRPERLVDLLQKGVPGFSSFVHNINRERTNVITGERFRVVWGEDALTETLCGLDYSVSAESFLQVNPVQTETLYSKAVGFADIGPSDTVLDLYCGIGTLTLAAAKLAKEAIGIEIVQRAIENARDNAAKNGVFNARFICGAAEQSLPELVREEKMKPETVLLDPPRKGCEAGVIEAIAETGAKKVVYVSCNPATLARDCALLAEKGFSFVKAQPVDMFPQTPHVECVILMSRVKV